MPKYSRTDVNKKTGILKLRHPERRVNMTCIDNRHENKRLATIVSTTRAGNLLPVSTLSLIHAVILTLESLIPIINSVNNTRKPAP
jgi:hypothetical protein